MCVQKQCCGWSGARGTHAAARVGDPAAARIGPPAGVCNGTTIAARTGDPFAERFGDPVAEHTGDLAAMLYSTRDPAHGCSVTKAGFPFPKKVPQLKPNRTSQSGCLNA